MGKRFTRQDGESMREFQDRCNRVLAEEAKERAVLAGRTRPRRGGNSRLGRADRRAADRVDGYDRDDLGESPDY